jgi:hypothetical protein
VTAARPTDGQRDTTAPRASTMMDAWGVIAEERLDEPGYLSSNEASNASNEASNEASLSVLLAS